MSVLPRAGDEEERLGPASTLIKGGRLVTASEDFVADLLIRGETIAAIGDSLDGPANRVIDATGRYVMPGCVDPHTHMDSPQAGTVSCDDFTSGTLSAAAGGTTTIVDFCFQQPGQTLGQSLATWHEKVARARPVVDVGFHIAVTDLSYAGALDELARLPAEQGVSSYKLFMAYKGSLMVDDGTLFEAMRVAARSGALVLVHAENGDAIDVLVSSALAEGHTEPCWHELTRPALTEAEATSRAIHLARIAGAPLYVVHVSCREALEPLVRAREAGWQVWGETCTQYLFVDRSALHTPGFEGAKYVFTPPPRGEEDRERLWRALDGGSLSVLSSDHCPFRFADQKALGRDDFSRIPNGAPGVENRLPMLHHFGVREGRISLSRMVELLSTEPARLFGLAPRKGTLAVGADADLVIFDPERPLTMSARTHHSNVDYSLFEGTRVLGGPETVLVRGAPVVDEGELVAVPGQGRFVKRARFGEPLPVRGAASPV
ncbi:MAG: dihydropyrimidinase [Thermoleophilaceae bacterium]